MTRCIVESIYLCLTFFYGCVFTVLFLSIPFTRKNVAIFSLFSFSSILCQLLLGYYCSMMVVITFYPLLVHVPLLLLCVFVYRSNVISSLISLLLCYFLTSPRYVLSFLLLAVFPHIPYGDITARSIATIPMALITYRFLLPSVKRSLMRTWIEQLYYFLPLIFIYGIFYVMTIFTQILIQHPQFTLELMTTIFFSIILYYTQVYLISQDEKRQLEQQEQFIINAQCSIQSQMRMTQDSYQRMRILRHDIRHENQIITAYAKEGNLQKILEHTQSVTSFLDDTHVPVYCQNTIVQLILSSYLTPFVNDSIPMDIQCHIPQEIFCDEADLCIILANALENAYHACKDIPHPTLKLSVVTMPDKILISIQNSCCNNIVFRNNLPVNNKKGHGIGTRSILAIAQKYYGICSFSCTDGIFDTEVILHRGY